MIHNSNSIYIATIKIDEVLSSTTIKNILSFLPEAFSDNVMKYQNPMQQSLSALGYALLNYLITPYDTSLDKLKYNHYGRPYLEAFLGDFNISRSNKIVICVLSSYSKVGIDIELIRNMDLTPYQEQLSVLELVNVKNNSKPMSQFYKFWTRKEAISKLDGRGLSLEFSKIHVITSPVSFNNTKVHFKEISIDKDYIVTIASLEEPKVSTLQYPTISECIYK